MLNVALTDPLQKPPFANASPDSLKGMAAKIRAVQLDVPNRVKAVQYLGTVDCITYPQAQEMLIATMMEDPSELVRYEAVMALRNMLTRGCCNMDTACECDNCCNRKKIVRETERHSRKGERKIIHEAKCHAKIAACKARRRQDAEEDRYDCCRGCANEKVMMALIKVATAKDDYCCWVEPSERVRCAATEGLCLFQNPGDMSSMPGNPLPPVDVTQPGEVAPVEPPPEIQEVKPRPEIEVSPEPIKPEQREVIPPSSSNSKINRSMPVTKNANGILQLSAEPQPLSPPIIPGLRGRCIVALKSRQVVASNAQFSSVYEGRTYFFSSAEAKSTFDRNPEAFAPMYGGIDPVNWLAKHEMVDGQVLREYDGHFFLFINKENWEVFKQNPQRYVVKTDPSKVQVVSGTR